MNIGHLRSEIEYLGGYQLNTEETLELWKRSKEIPDEVIEACIRRLWELDKEGKSFRYYLISLWRAWQDYRPVKVGEGEKTNWTVKIDGKVETSSGISGILDKLMEKVDVKK